MSQAPTRPPNRLARLVQGPGGLAAEEAVRAADAGLERIRDDVVREIAAVVARMQALGAALEGGPDEGALRSLYGLANSVVGMAGVFGMAPLGEVCFSLCELIDRMAVRQRWEPAAVRVHLDSIGLLRPGAPAGERGHEEIVAALRRVVERV